MFRSRILRLTAKHQLRVLVFAIGGVVAGLSPAVVCAADAPPPMTVGGQFDVSPTGAATYSIPIAVPPGTAGLVPSLSLNYSSQSGNGIVGFGWSLGGLPSITRCPQTYAQDGVLGSVNYDSNDRFCLDGQRLLKVSGSGGYGAANSEYRTEIDTFSKIIVRNPDDNTRWFEVHTKSGQVIELGNTPDSRILPKPAPSHGSFSVAKAWLADKVADTVGNYFQVFYQNDTTNGQYYPDHIVYTRNDAAGLNAYNSVWFKYGSRTFGSISDVVPLYHEGSQMQTTVLLSDIRTYLGGTTTEGGTIVSDYHLDYQLSNANTIELTTIKRCSATTITPANCLVPTTLTWNNGATWSSRIAVDGTSYALPTYTQSGVPNPIVAGSYINGDFNGDGVSDASSSFISASGCYNALSDGVPLLSTPGPGISNPNFTNSYSDGSSGTSCIWGPSIFIPFRGDGVTPVSDFDGDGLVDLIPESGTGIPVRPGVLLNDGAGHFVEKGTDGMPPVPVDPAWAAWGNYGDLDGDGRTDYVTTVPTNPAGYAFRFSRSDGGAGDGTFVSGATHASVPSPSNIFLVGDADGDGCEDYLFQGAENDVRSSCNAATPIIPVTNYYASGNTYLSGDFNGDGNSDFIMAPYYSGGDFGTGQLNISTGTSFITSSLPSDFDRAGNVKQYLVGDFDGDGKSDVLLINSTSYSIYTWQTSGFALALTVSADLPKVGCDGGCSDPNANGTVSVADVDGDGCTDLVVQQPGLTVNPFWYQKFGCRQNQLMTGFSNGLGATTTITYDRLNQNTFYTKCTGQPGVYRCNRTAYPTQSVDGALYVVTRIDTSNGIGGNFSSTYAYSGAKKDLLGRGFLGFEQVAVTDLQTNVTRTTSYNMLFPYSGTVTEEKLTATGTNGTVVLKDSINSYGTVPATPVMGTPTFVYLATTTMSAGEVDNTVLPGSTVTHMNPDGSPGYDTFGNPTYIQTTIPDGSSKTTNNIWSNNASTWIIGRLTNTTVTSVVGSSSITRSSSFHYLSNGVLDRETIEPNSIGGCGGTNASCTLDTLYTNFDTFGHWQTKTVSGAGFAARVATRTFDVLGEFETSETNPATQTEYFDYTGTYGPSFGVLTKHTDANGNFTTFTYDSFGRQTNQTRSGIGGQQTDASYAYCTTVAGGTVVCPTNGAFATTTTPYNHGHAAQNGPQIIAYYDSLGRMIATDVEGYDGPLQSSCGSPCWIRADTNYNNSGYVWRTDRPYFVTGGTPKYTAFDYTVPASGNQDPSGRVWKATAPGSIVTTYAYTGLGNAGSQASVTNADSQATVTAKNPQGLVASVQNALNVNNTTTYSYDAYGDLLTVTDPLGNQIVNTYDIRGNKLTSNDPDMGAWSYTYDALGELLNQTDAKSQTTTLTYDPLGRVKTRTEPDQTSTWTYDSATNGIGLIGSATGSNANYSRTYFYDPQSRPSKVTLKVSGVSYNYIPAFENTNGRLDTLTYPSGLVVKYVYTTLGYLYQLKDNATGAVLWTANVRDAEMHLADQSAGDHTRTIAMFDPNTGLVQQIRAGAGEADNGSVANFDYTFDPIGNLTNRTDMLEGYAENFCYDKLNRLKNYSVDGTNGTNCLTGRAGLVKSASYDAIGNLTKKSDLAGIENGAYTYPTPGGGTGTHPHAVTSIAGTVNGVVDPHYVYDPNGNLLCEYTGSSCIGGGIVRETDQYWSSNMTKTITEGTTSLAFVYDSEHARITQTVNNGSPVTTTYLNDPITGAMSEMVSSGGTPTWNDYLMANGKMIGQRTCSGAAPCSTGATTEYFVLDHLGSVAVVTSGMSGVTRESFDAWGRQRNADGSDDPTCSLGSSSPNTRRFTGQEHIDTMCLINLNARIYDPTIARFMVADNIVPDPYDGQSYNRYTYTDNRPLSFTDPTGHDKNVPWCIGVCGGTTGTWADGGRCGGFSCAHPEASCSGNCYGAGTTLLDRVTAAGAKVHTNTDGSNVINFTCSAGSTCEKIGNGAVFANGGTITGDNERSRFGDFVHQMGGDVAFIDMDNGVYAAVAPSWAASATIALHNSGDTNAGNGQSNKTVVAANFGIVAAAGAEAGIGQCHGNNCNVRSAGGQVSWYGSLFWGGDTSPSVGAGQTTGNYVGKSHDPAHSVQGAVGAYGGVGVGVTFGNGTSNAQVLGPFNTRTVNTPIGSMSYSMSGEIWQATITIGPGAIASVSNYTTNTKSCFGPRC